MTDTPDLLEINRVGIIGDVHGEDNALEAALLYLKSMTPSLDVLLCTGDVPAKHGIGDADRCCQLLSQGNVQTIRGNHDRWQIENASFAAELRMDEPLTLPSRSFLRGLPKTRTFHTPLGTLLLCHGLGENDMAGIYPGGEDAPIMEALKTMRIYSWHRFVVAGHTHKRMLRPVGTVTLLNPGTLRFDENPGFALVDFNDNFVQFYDLAPFTNVVSKAERQHLLLP